MKLSKHAYLLITILTCIVFIVESLTLFILYDTTFEQQHDRLVTTARSQTRLIETVTKFDAKFSKDDHSGGASGATLSQIREAHQEFGGFGETGELVIGMLDNNKSINLTREHARSLG